MPNHVETLLTVTGTEENIKKFVETCMIEKAKEDWNGGGLQLDPETGNPIIFTELDFNKIIPMPESMHITSGTSTDNAVALIKAENGDLSDILSSRSFLGSDCPDGTDEVEFIIGKLKKRVSDEDLKQGQMALDNIEKHGYKDWYSWSVANWGTKWGAYDCVVVENGGDDKTFFLEYNTAWSPASPIISKLGEMFPELMFTNNYLDEGRNFFGTHTVCGEEGIDEDAAYECEGDEFLNFANNVFGYHLDKCAKCNAVYNPEWSEGDGTLCYDCENPEDA